MKKTLLFVAIFLLGFQTISAFNLLIADVQVTESNAGDVLNDGGSVKYDFETHTLTLTNANVGEWTYVDEPITIVCVGENYMTCPISNYAALHSDADSIVISGPGTLNLYSNGEPTIRTMGTVIVNNGCTVMVSGKTNGILFHADKSLVVDNAALILKGNNNWVTISGCTNLIMNNGVAIRTNHTFDTEKHIFIDNKTGEEAKNDIIIGQVGAGLEDLVLNNQTQSVKKVFKNGQLYIISKDNVYNAQGSRF